MKRMVKLLTLVMVMFCSWSGALYANGPILQGPYTGNSKFSMAAFSILALIMIFLISAIVVGFKRSKSQIFETQNPKKKEK